MIKNIILNDIFKNLKTALELFSGDTHLEKKLQVFF
jgi:hypothetical protein